MSGDQSPDKSSLFNRRDYLQNKVGAFPVVVAEAFQNWGKTHTVNVLSVKPKNADEVVKVVTAANTSVPQFTIRCVGDGHSWSFLYPDEGNILMYTEEIMPDSKQRITLKEVCQSSTGDLRCRARNEFKVKKPSNTAPIPATMNLEKFKQPRFFYQIPLLR